MDIQQNDDNQIDDSNQMPAGDDDDPIEAVRGSNEPMSFISNILQEEVQQPDDPDLILLQPSASSLHPLHQSLTKKQNISQSAEPFHTPPQMVARDH